MTPPPKKTSRRSAGYTRPKVVPLRRRPGYVQVQPPTVIRPIRENEIDQALKLFLADPSGDPRLRDKKVSSFRTLARQEKYDLTRQIVALQDDKLIYACLFVPNPGGTAFVFTARPPQTQTTNDQLAHLPTQALGRLCQWAFQGGSSLLQVLLEPADTARQKLCLQCGFKRLTDLIYLFRLSDSPTLEFHQPQPVSWLFYDPKNHDLFKTVIAQTYHGSLDCPELENLRDIDDVIRGHQAVGRFDPRCWKLLLVHDEPVGVLLLSTLRSADTMELTYMGLCPAARGRNLGKVLLAEALASARRHRIKSLTLAVDSRNKPAYHLYTNGGFTAFLRRTVLIRSAHWQ